jgi:TolB protein
MVFCSFNNKWMFGALTRGHACRLATVFFAFFVLFVPTPQAQLTIEISGVGATQIPVAVVPFSGDHVGANTIPNVIQADLQRSGLMRTLDTRNAARPATPNAQETARWRAAGADAVVVGSVLTQPDGRIDVRYYLLDAATNNQLAAFAYLVNARDSRAVAHRIADQVFEKLTGVPGVFSTRIAYVMRANRGYSLQVADYDGENSATILSSNEPIISPAWSPDGRRLAYVSFESRKPVVWVHDVTSAQRRAVANFKGSNSAPAWSPDGSRLAVALTQDGPTQVYIINADGSGVRRFTQSGVIDTSPAWMPDGTAILFTSDRGGSPQIYRQAVGGGGAERLTFEGSYNAMPRVAPDGKSFVFIRREGNREMIATQDFGSRQVQTLTSGGIDESPTFAPNGKTVLYASLQGGRGILGMVSIDGRIKQRITGVAGDIREPAWGPFVQ